MAENKRDYYEVLGLGKGASEDEIKKAYRRLAKNIIQTLIRVTNRLKPTLKRSTKPTRFFRQPEKSAV